MKRLDRISVLFSIVAVFCATAFLYSFSINPYPVSAATGLIPLDSKSGRELLMGNAFVEDYESLTRNFEAQARPTFCGIASSVVVLNAMRNTGPRLTQSTFFDEATKGSAPQSKSLVQE